MLPIDPQEAIDRLLEFQRAVRSMLIASRRAQGLAAVSRESAADTIYAIDAVVEPLLEQFCSEWGKTTPLALIAEGAVDEAGNEGTRIFPAGAREADAKIRLIVDPIDGTRGIMYDKRPAWALAGVAPNLGPTTRLGDLEVSVMTELPTSKMGCADVLWAIRGRGAQGRRIDLRDGQPSPLPLRPSQAQQIDHGFASVSSFFPGTKRQAAELMEFIARKVMGAIDVTKAAVFDDQYISTGGQFYELIVGHDRFIADLRPLFYQMSGAAEGLCCHPYDCAGMVVAQEAGVILTNGLGGPLDGPLDTHSSLSWAGYANAALRGKIEAVIRDYFATLT